MDLLNSSWIFEKSLWVGVEFSHTTSDNFYSKFFVSIFLWVWEKIYLFHLVRENRRILLKGFSFYSLIFLSFWNYSEIYWRTDKDFFDLLHWEWIFGVWYAISTSQFFVYFCPKERPLSEVARWNLTSVIIVLELS